MPRPLEVLATPTLIRAARGVYGRAIRAELLALGVDDLPRNGAVLLARISNEEPGTPHLPSELGVTKQAISQVIDVLVTRGYVERTEDPDDRRRISLALTDRGVEVTEAVVRAVDRIDAELINQVSAAEVQAMRSALIALSRIKADEVAAGTSVLRPPRQLRQFQPIFLVRDLKASLEHYAALGFRVEAYDDEGGYGFASRERTGLQLSTHEGHDPKHNHCSTYLYVADADALYDEWTQPGIGGETIAVEAMPWKLREGAHIDPDGNLIRFGSWIAE
jgi:DNA-binding MarR family transcriptional regulator/catechol 2,3-dioxygenase-like lactoylglutathione lyase family enzyme